MGYLINRISFYYLLPSLIILCVLLVIGGHSFYLYNSTKMMLTEELGREAELAAQSLKENLRPKIAAYAVGEYEQLLLNEMKAPNIQAILVEDYKMAEIVGKSHFVTGKVRLERGDIADYAPENPRHQASIESSLFSHRYAIYAQSGEPLGEVTLYTSGAALTNSLAQIIEGTIANALIVSSLLLLILFLVIHRALIAPIAGVVRRVEDVDSRGIPKLLGNSTAPKEIHQLRGAINKMIGELRVSYRDVEQQRRYLQSIIDGVSDPIMVIDRDYSVLLKNIAASDPVVEQALLSGCESQKCYQVNHRQDHPCDERRHPCPMRRVLETRSEVVVLHTHRINNEERYIEVSATPLFDDFGMVKGIIETGRDITPHMEYKKQLEEQRDELTYLANHDSLTGLANRFMFIERLKQGVAKAKRHKTRLAVLFIDLDHFKEINDTMGHKAGDRVLVEVAERISKLIRTEDTLARLGGDEFTVMLEDVANLEGPARLAQQIIEHLSGTIEVNGKSFFMGCSIGISLCPENSLDPGDLLKYADAAMYKAKTEGRNNHQFYTQSLTLRTLERISKEALMREEIERGGAAFELHYQPQIDVQTGEVSGVEALVRWQHPEQGLLPPGEFIDIAESSGLIIPLGNIILHQALQQMAVWREAGIAPRQVAVNCSMRQLHQDDFVAKLRAMAERIGVPLTCLEVEVTESELMINPELVIELLRELAELGVTISLDDFGTGYSSLAYLKKLPISKLKIDRSFISELPHDADDINITQAIIALATSLGLELIAEGVETEEQQEFLLDNGCRYVQGYLHSKPLAVGAIEPFISQQSRASEMDHCH